MKMVKNLISVFRTLDRKYRCLPWIAVFNALVQSVKPYITIVLTGYLIDGVYNGESFDRLILYALGAAGAVGVLSIIDSIGTKFFNQSLEYMLEISEKPLLSKSLTLDYEFLEDGDVYTKRKGVNRSYPRFGLIGTILSNINKTSFSLFSCVWAVIVAFPVLFVRDGNEYGFIGSWCASFIFIVLIALIIIIDSKNMSYFMDRRYEAVKSGEEHYKVVKFYLDILANADKQKDMRVYAQEELYAQELRQVSKKVNECGREATKASTIDRALSNALMGFMKLCIYGFAGLRVYVGMISIGSVVAAAASIYKLTSAVDVVEGCFYLKEKTAYVQDCLDFLRLEKRRHDGTIPVEKRRDNKFSVEFSNVSFKYPGSEEYVIKDLNLKFVIGEKMAIVGKNGSGKSTFIKLLCRLYDVTEGCIKVNGIDIRKYDYREYCDLFSVVFQDFAIFDFPLGETVAASAKVDEVRAYDALNRAGLKERVEELRGLKTYIGKDYDEGGVDFSGGEKQKLAIARAIYKDAPFVIMDEPTAALDPEAEAAVFAGFEKMVGKKTAIYISHRLASCRFCDDIMVFDKGQVVQRGSHDELRAEGGLHGELWNAQAQYYA